MSGNSSNSNIHLLDLPNEMLQEIMSYLTYDEIAKYRAVCKKFDRNGRQMLNRGYQLIIGQLKKHVNEIDSKLPRQEPEHPLVNRKIAVSPITDALYILRRHYYPYIQAGLCCFIAGKVIDEAIRAFRNVITSTKNGRQYLNSHDYIKYVEMATDHFKDVVEPSLQSMSDNQLDRNMNDFKMSSSETFENNMKKSIPLFGELFEQELSKNLEGLEKSRAAILREKKKIRKLKLEVNEDTPYGWRLHILELQQGNRKSEKLLKRLIKRVLLERRIQCMYSKIK